MTGTPIPAIDQPVMPDLDADLTAFLESLTERVRAGANWMVRKKILMDALVAVEKLALMSEEERAMLLDAVRQRMADGAPGPSASAPPDEEPDAAADGTGDSAEGGEGDTRTPPPAMLILLYCGAVLESLAETEIRSAEQAMVYALSIHPAHNQAAIDWSQSDPRNTRAMRKLIRHDRRFKHLFDSVSSLVKASQGPDSLSA